MSPQEWRQILAQLPGHSGSQERSGGPRPEAVAQAAKPSNHATGPDGASPSDYEARLFRALGLGGTLFDYRAQNASQAFDAYFGGEGFEIHAAGETASPWHFGLALSGIGRGGAMRAAEAGAAVSEGARVRIVRPGLTEWFENGLRGLEHGMNIARRPEGKTGPLRVEFEAAGNLLLRQGGSGVIGTLPGDQFARFHYSELKARDAKGKELPARMELSQAEAGKAVLSWIIEDGGAEYPLEVDPLATTAAWTSTEIARTTSVAWGDWDGDGDLDLAVGNLGQPNRVYANLGGVLSLAWGSMETDDTTSVAWGDWDGDGDLDLAVGNYGQPNRVYASTGGTLSATAAWSSTEMDHTTSVAWGDWDGDGDLDLAVGNYYGQPNRVYANTGGALSLAWSSTETEWTTSVAWGDWDSDGDLDLAVGNYDQINRVYANTGGALSLAWTSTETDGTTSVAWGDWDGDGDLDLVVGNDFGQPNRVYANTGGALSATAAWTSTETDGTTSVAWGDWDGDGDLDLAVGNSMGNLFGQPNRVYANTGGALSLAWSSTETDQTYSVAWGDWDGDGDLDLAVGNDYGQPNRVYANMGGALSATAAWTSTEMDRTASEAWGDWDGDGDLDLAVGNANKQPNRVYANTGGALAATAAWSSPETDSTTSVAWGDWDGDGDLDLAVGNNGNNRVYANTGGGLSLAWSSTETDDTSSVAWGDWDGDDDLDLAVGNSNQPNRVYANTGGGLSLAWSSMETDDTSSVAWGDWDSDGDLDLAVGNNGTNRVYANTGGALSFAWTSTETEWTVSVAWGDWDGDGDLDLAVGNDFGQPNRVYANTGGALSLAWSSTETDDTYSVAWGDWDGDGDLDLAVGNANNQPNRVYANTGGALAATAAWSSTETDDTTSVAWGDWDSDGDLDLAVGNWGANRVYANGRNFIPSGLPESPVLPVTLDRPGTTDGAFFFSSAERLVSPVTVPYTLCDAEGDTAWKIVPEYSLRGGGRWLAATAGAGGDGTTGLSASPAGEAHTFVWDSAADGAHSDNAVFRISVEWQAPDHAGYPIQRPRVSSVTPPFRVVACIEGVTAGGPTTFCEGESVQLSAAPEAGTGPFTYLWSPGNATTQAVTVTEAGTYSCEVTDTASGCGNTVTTNAVAVTVHPNPGAPTEIVWMLPKGDKSGFTWANMTGADYYRVVRATPAGLASYDFTTCVGYGITDGAAGADITGDVPAEGTCHYYIVQGYACIDPDENLSPAGDGVLERTLTATTCDGD